MQTEREHHSPIKRSVQITNFCSSNLKITRVGETSRKNGRVVIRHGRSCEQGALKDVVPWRKKDRATVQSFDSLLGRPYFKEEELKSVGELSNVRSQIVLKCLYVARIGRPDTLRSVNKLGRAVTKWNQACDRRLVRLISYSHHTNDYRHYCHVGDTAQRCRLELFQDSDFAGDLEDSKSTSGVISCIFGGRTFVPTSWMCMKQTSVSHSSTASEVISLDGGLRMDDIPALDLWDVVIEVLHSSNNRKSSTEDNEAVIKMIIKEVR